MRPQRQPLRRVRAAGTGGKGVGERAYEKELGRPPKSSFSRDS